jgi:sulfopyruvate decarboxylase subunit alpha
MPVSNEGVGVGLCCGAWLGGMKAVMLMENTGVRMACDQLARLGMSVGLPCFMMIPYRGDIGDKQTYAVAHGKTMLPVLEALQIPYFIVRDENQIRQAIRRCLTTLSVTNYHVALIMGAEVCMDEL